MFNQPLKGVARSKYAAIQGIRRIKDLDNISELERLPPESHNFY
jgi:hypothetical protein